MDTIIFGTHLLNSCRLVTVLIAGSLTDGCKLQLNQLVEMYNPEAVLQLLIEFCKGKHSRQYKYVLKLDLRLQLQ